MTTNEEHGWFWKSTLNGVGDITNILNYAEGLGYEITKPQE